MRYQRKIVSLLTAFCLLQCLLLNTSAVTTSVERYENNQETVIINVLAETDDSPDFVTEFPVIEMEEKKTNPRPSPELALQERKEYVSIPQYYQTDYPDTLYSDGTVATDGCSITAVAMIATYMTGYQFLPDELAYYFGGRAENNMARMEYALKTVGVPYEKPKNWDITYAELEAGKCAIVLVEGASKFTDTQHFLVLTGLTEDGKVLVNDPFKPNYEKWDLKEGFAHGFNSSYIINGYQGAWVFDKTQMPEELERYFEAPPEPVESRYPEIELTFAERQLLARVIWAEARGESAEGQQAVAEVVLNRMESEIFPDRLRDVIYEDGQFRSVSKLDDAEPGQAQYRAIEGALYGPYVLPEDVHYFATFKTNDKLWGKIGGHFFCFADDKDMTTAIVQDTSAE